MIANINDKCEYYVKIYNTLHNSPSKLIVSEVYTSSMIFESYALPYFRRKTLMR